MKIVSLVENKSHITGLKAVHGLCLYIETKKHKILFDLGPDDTLINNALLLGVNLSSVDTVIISHGHNDHGGGLSAFLAVNSKARIYIQRSAFYKHFSKNLLGKSNIGLRQEDMESEQVILLDGNFEIDEELALFTSCQTDRYHSPANDTLYEGESLDHFLHEHNLLIKRGTDRVLFMGCGHSGVVNILESLPEEDFPNYVFGGFHLCQPSLNKSVPDELVYEIACYLNKYSTRFYTFHCTGEKAYYRMQGVLKDKMKYLSTGEMVIL